MMSSQDPITNRRSTGAPKWRTCRLPETEDTGMKDSDTVVILDEIPQEEETIKSLGVTLLEHQLYGLRWMTHVENTFCKRGGILADDMGMGKTMTCCALVKSSFLQGERRPQLIVCPKSVVSHWKSELDRCGISTRELPANHELRLDTVEDAGHVVYLSSTIALCYRRDALVREGGWARVIVDEAHLVNNPRAQTYQVLDSIQASHKWAVTGTPLMNALKDVHALSALVTPTEPYPSHDARAARDWKARYFLRRLKGATTVNLPEMIKIEEWVHPTSSELSAYQRIAKDVTDTNKPCNVLTSLSDLRRQCDHPSMASEDRDGPPDILKSSKRSGPGLEEQESPYTSQALPLAHSSKTSRMLDIIKSYPQDIKFVIFSQWTRMLDICEQLLSQEGFATMRYDGAIQETSKRAAVIQRFGTCQTTRILLTSMRAGGVGLNLTMANVIIQLDPWWNYCSEQQAYGRVYRIGQKNKVYVHRLLVKSTVEEQVLLIQTSKNDISANFLSRQMPEFSSFGPEDVKAIYSGPNRTRAHRLGAVTNRTKRPKLMQSLTLQCQGPCLPAAVIPSSVNTGHL